MSVVSSSLKPGRGDDWHFRLVVTGVSCFAFSKLAIEPRCRIFGSLVLIGSLFFFTSGEPTPSPLTGGSDRREPEEPGNPNFRPQSFNQPFPHQSLYPQASMPYRGAGEQYGPGHERMSGREPWFNDRAHAMGMGLPPPLKRPNPTMQDRGTFLPPLSPRHRFGCLLLKTKQIKTTGLSVMSWG